MSIILTTDELAGVTGYPTPKRQLPKKRCRLYKSTT